MSGAAPRNGDGVDGVRQAAEDACLTMQAALAALKDSTDASCPAPSRHQVQAAVQLLRMEVAKTGLLYSPHSGSGGGGPSTEEAAALLSSFQRASCSLCMLFTGIAAAGGGPTLRSSLHQTATAVVEACCALIRGAVGGGAREAQLMMLSGLCLEMLEAAGKAPLDSRAAIGRAITKVLKQLADAQKELDETIETATEGQAGGANGGAGAADGEASAAAPGDSEDGGSDRGWGFDEEALSEGQLAVARRVRALLAAAAGLVRAVVRRLLAEREGLDAEGVEGWESMLYHVKTLAPLCDDLAAAVYPPQDAEELAAAAEALLTSCELLLEECPDPAEAHTAAAAGGGAPSQQGGGVAALQAALREVVEAHAALAACLEAEADAAE